MGSTVWAARSRSIAMYSSMCCATLHGMHTTQVRVFNPLRGFDKSHAPVKSVQ